MDALVGRLRDATQERLGCLAGALSLLERFGRDSRGDLAGLRATHTVGDNEQWCAGEVRVLVCGPLPAGVGAKRLLGDAQHQLAARDV